MDLQASHAEDDMSISLAQQAAAAQQSYATASECSYTDCLTLRRIALPIATPLPHALAHTIANITRPFAYIANAHDVAKRRLRLHQPLPWLRLKPCADVTAAVRTRVCSSTTATLAARLSSSPFFCQHYGSPRCAHAIIARVYAVYCSRVQVRYCQLKCSTQVCDVLGINTLCLWQDSLSAMMAVTAQAYFHEGSRQLAHGQACEAARSFQRAIDAGHAESHAALSYMHYGTYRGVPPCHSKVFQLASAGAKMGCIHSKGALADCLRTGIGTAVDVAEAFRLATESADAGSLYGQHSLACAYRRGIGISQNDAIAARLFLLAAEQGEVHSHDWLGNMYRPRAPSCALK